MANRSKAAAVLAIVLSCLAASARAQPSAEPGDLTPARAWFERGLALSEAQRWVEARAAYERSLELGPHVSTYFNLAIILVKLGEGRAALGALDAFELLADADKHKEFISEAASLREKALALTGTLMLALLPADARLRIDGAELSEPSGAKRRVRLDTGAHTLELSAPEHLTTSLVVRVEPGVTVELSVVLAPVVRPDLPSRLEPSSGPVVTPPAEPRGEAASSRTNRQRRNVWLWTSFSLVVAGAAAAAIGIAVTRKDGHEDARYAGSTGIVFGQN